MRKAFSVALSIFALGVVADSALAQSGTSSNGAGAPGHVPVRVIQPATAHDVAELTYPNTLDTGSEPTGVLLTEPYRLAPDGIHIWRDATGIWTIYRGPSASLTITGTVRPLVAAQLHVFSGGTPSIPVSALSLDEPTVWADNQVRFVVAGDLVEFDLAMDGVKEPGLIHIGAKGKSPVYVPFRLENRPASARPPAAHADEANPSSLSSVASQLGPPPVGGGAGPAKKRQ